MDTVKHFYGDQGPTREARDACRVCQGRPGCLAAAMREEEGHGLAARYGFRGGLTAEERYRKAKAAGDQPRLGRGRKGK